MIRVLVTHASGNKPDYHTNLYYFDDYKALIKEYSDYALEVVDEHKPGIFCKIIVHDEKCITPVKTYHIYHCYDDCKIEEFEAEEDDVEDELKQLLFLEHDILPAFDSWREYLHTQGALFHRDNLEYYLVRANGSDAFDVLPIHVS